MVFLKRETSPHTVKWHDFSMTEMGWEEGSGEIVKILRNSPPPFPPFFFPFLPLSLSLRIIRKRADNNNSYLCVPILSRQGGGDDRSSSFTSSVVSSKGRTSRRAKVDVLAEGSNIKTSRRVKLLRKGFQSWLPL